MDTIEGKKLLERKVWSVQEVAEMLGISVSLTYSMVRSGQIPTKTLGTRRRIIPKDAFELWLKETDKRK